LPGHDVFTVAYMGWSGINNGALLTQAVTAGFDAFVTIDRGIPFQPNVGQLSLAVVVLSAWSNRFGEIVGLIPRLVGALNL
jgi:hypothetical protein